MALLLRLFLVVLLVTTSRGYVRRLDLRAQLIVGLNKYSHDASCCIVDASSGKVLFTQAKERLTRSKHAGGGVGELVNYGLQAVGATVGDVATVVSNNHHFRVLPFERRLPFAHALGYTPMEYLDPSNLLPNAQHFELSHHLAHAWCVRDTVWRDRKRLVALSAHSSPSPLPLPPHPRRSVVGTAPFDAGLVVVMDGMGEAFRAMAEDAAGLEEASGDYMHDLKLLKVKRST
jgi:hypothetical protein